MTEHQIEEAAIPRFPRHPRLAHGGHWLWH